MRSRFTLLALVALLCLGTESAAASDRVVERGIVQSVSADRLVLRALDGTDVVVAVGSETRFRLNGLPASGADVLPGQVAEAVVLGGGQARVVRAFGQAVRRVTRGVIVSISPTRIEIQGGLGRRGAFEVTRRTKVRIGIISARTPILRIGLRVEVVRAADGSARLIIVRRGRA